MLKTAESRLRKAIISNCNKELLKCINECVLNVLKGNINQTVCNTCKLRKHKAAIRKVTFSQNVSGPTMTLFTRWPAWRSRVWQIRTNSLFGRRWRLRDAYAFAWLGSRLGWSKRAYQKGEDEVCQGRGTEFPHRNISDYESYRKASTARLRARSFRQDADRGTVLPGGTDSDSHFETDRLQDR